MFKNKKLNYLILLFVLLLAIYVFYKHKTKTTIIVSEEKTKEIEQDDELEDDEHDIDDIISQIAKEQKQIKQKCKITEDKFNMNSSKCLATKVDLCKLGSYKQCTNNKKPIFKSCDCQDPNSILCDRKDNVSEKCLHDYQVFDMKQKFKDNKNNTRVNMFHSNKKTVFDKLK